MPRGLMSKLCRKEILIPSKQCRSVVRGCSTTSVVTIAASAFSAINDHQAVSANCRKVRRLEQIDRRRGHFPIPPVVQRAN